MLVLVVFLVALVDPAVGPDPCCLRVSPYHIQALAQRMAQRFQALEFRAQDLRNVFSAFQAVHGNVSTRLRLLETDHAQLYAEVLRMNTRLEILEAEKRIEEYRQRLKLDTDWYLSQRGRRHNNIPDHNSDNATPHYQNKTPFNASNPFTDGNDTVLPNFDSNLEQTAKVAYESGPLSLELPVNASGLPVLIPSSTDKKNFDTEALPTANISSESLSSTTYRPVVNSSDLPELLSSKSQDFENIVNGYSKVVNSSGSTELSDPMLLDLDNTVSGYSEVHGTHKGSVNVSLSSSQNQVVNSSDSPLKVNLFEPLTMGVQNNGSMFSAAFGTNGSLASLDDSRRIHAEFMDLSGLYSKNITMSNLVALPETEIRPLEVTEAPSDNTTDDLNFADKLLNETGSTNDTSGLMLIDADLSDAELQEALKSLNEMLIAARREDPASGEDNEKVLLKRALALALETLERTSDACLQLVNATTDAFEGLANEERFR